jgi:hypothetical protein
MTTRLVAELTDHAHADLRGLHTRAPKTAQTKFLDLRPACGILIPNSQATACGLKDITDLFKGT